MAWSKTLCVRAEHHGTGDVFAGDVFPEDLGLAVGFLQGEQPAADVQEDAAGRIDRRAQRSGMASFLGGGLLGKGPEELFRPRRPGPRSAADRRRRGGSAAAAPRRGLGGASASARGDVCRARLGGAGGGRVRLRAAPAGGGGGGGAAAVCGGADLPRRRRGPRAVADAGGLTTGGAAGGWRASAARMGLAACAGMGGACDPRPTGARLAALRRQGRLRRRRPLAAAMPIPAGGCGRGGYVPAAAAGMPGWYGRPRRAAPGRARLRRRPGARRLRRRHDVGSGHPPGCCAGGIAGCAGQAAGGCCCGTPCWPGQAPGCCGIAGPASARPGRLRRPDARLLPARRPRPGCCGSRPCCGTPCCGMPCGPGRRGPAARRHAGLGGPGALSAGGA